MDRTSDYDFDLPAGLIAQQPADRRDASRLMVVGERLGDRHFGDVVEVIPDGAVLAINDTQVLAARLRARKETGGFVELVVLEPVESGAERVWRCIARASKPMRPGQELNLEGPGAYGARVVEGRDDRGHIICEFSAPVFEICAHIGDMPLPPYIRRAEGATDTDRERYQTVYADKPGAVAAPTAGLHFTDEIFEALAGRGVEVARLTLHVGAGTFSPLAQGRLAEQSLHVERFEIPESTAALVNSGRPVVAVGTTSLRALEAAGQGGTVVNGPSSTDLFIRPGYRFRVVKHLITNFHLPQSSLLVLVCAFAGYERMMAAYRHAVAAGYRFYSYGDAMFLSREDLF
ncbi:MAG: tRNA preQ1(34) S-adenosylmethionine ribosyltransferase-isomerase QueA [Deltaproteobacteria bacterium]|nr:tRNA preQ1(34) S-adenosylmethionine ribosyltransferase-isomerase QueA [Deltaproteobacteria bacterium]